MIQVRLPLWLNTTGETTTFIKI